MLGVVTWAIMAFCGMEFAVFWGVLIALLNYVPYIGSFLSIFLPAVTAISAAADVICSREVSILT